MKQKTQVIVVMGSQSDLSVMSQACEILENWGISFETLIVSAHRTPKLLETSVHEWEEAGVKVIIAGAGGAAHLPGMLASFSILPVIGVPVKSKAMNGLDALLSIAQMPRGVPVATVAVDNATNAGILAAQIIAADSSKVGDKARKALLTHKRQMSSQVTSDRKKLSALGVRAFLKHQS